MNPRCANAARLRPVLVLGALLGLVLGTSSDVAFAQAPAYATSCPPPLKLAAGACVRTCPASYADTGRTCVFQDMFH